MRAPPDDRPLYWALGGDVVARDAEMGGRLIGLDAAVRLHSFHCIELDAAAAADERAARDFHRACDDALVTAIAAACAWRRAARVA